MQRCFNRYLLYWQIPVLVLGLFCAAVLQAQSEDPQQPPPQPQPGSSAPPNQAMAGTQVDTDGAELTFARLIYSGAGYSWNNRGRWTTDMPEAEHFFMEGIERLTRIDAQQVNIYNGEGGETVDLSEDALFDYPFLYAVEVGYWQLDAEEAEKLREYLLRGGFLLIDDFHGSQEWSGFMEQMRRVFPSRPVEDVPLDDPVFNVFHDLEERRQIPGLAALYRGQTWEKDGFNPHWRGIYDDQGRLMVAINHNMDLGDAWEHADMPEYPEPMTAMAYRLAVNYVIYAMTH